MWFRQMAQLSTTMSRVRRCKEGELTPCPESDGVPLLSAGKRVWAHLFHFESGFLVSLDDGFGRGGWVDLHFGSHG